MAVTATQGPLTGLPRRLVQDGVISEADLVAALSAIDGKSALLVPHLVANRLGDARQIAIAAAHEFGVPLLDLDAVDLDLDVVRLVNEKLLLKHRILPILQRGKRLFIAVCDPTNLQVLDEPLPETPHDFRVDRIATPTRVLVCAPAPRPRGILWEDLDAAKIASIPALASRAQRGST